MKKIYNTTDINQKHGNEVSKKLYRTINDQLKRLDDARSCARHISDLFCPSLQIQRRKLCDYCERLIFSDPLIYGRKAEELLWRKCYYEVVLQAKKLKRTRYSQDEVLNLQCHINSDLSNVVDFYDRFENDLLNLHVELNESEWVSDAIHQCLIYLGDLNRYKLEIYPNWDTSIAVRYYLQAASYKPDFGMPYNQMGTLAMNQNCNLDAVYHYMRCLACKFPFEGTTNNMIGLFEKNSKYIEELPEINENSDCIIEPSRSDHVKRFLARFLLLIDIWYFNKTVTKVYNLCHQTFKDLDRCLSYVKPTSENGDSPVDVESFESDSTSSPSYLSDDTLFKIATICLFCISKSQSVSNQTSMVTAFTMAVYSQLVRNVTSHIQTSILNYPVTDPEINGNARKKRKKMKLRRRKIVHSESDESEPSDEGNSPDGSSDDSFMSDKENVLASSSEDEIEAITGQNKAIENDMVERKEEPDEQKQKHETISKMKKMDVNDMLEIISEQGLLQSVKILNDWLMQDSSIIKSCGTNTRSLFRQIAYLLNLVNIDLKRSKIKIVDLDLTNRSNIEKHIPLPEDAILKSFNVLSPSQKDLDWQFLENNYLSVKEESIIRIIKLLAFGHFLSTINESGIFFDETKEIFECHSNDSEELQLKSVIEELDKHDELGVDLNGKSKEINANSKGQLLKMKHMGQLWLASEVRALESRVRGKTSLSPYLVLDADALIKYTFMVKHLVHSRKFIVLIPSAVVSALDDLKRLKPEARDAIRWLESQFHKGNRFFRSQRPQEKLPIPFVKYPKKKDKEMYLFIQIIECCYYLAEQQNGATNVVTLLIGNQNLLINADNKDFSYLGLAQSAGVCIESITQFYGKWKKSSKEKR